MRYLFRGRRETGEPVEGRVTAPTQDVANDILGDNGIVADSLEPEPAAPDEPAATVAERQDAHVLGSALDDADFRVSFDHVTRRYQGTSVCVLERDKIRNVTKLVDEAIVDNQHDDEKRRGARRHIAQVLEKILQDRRNLSAERSAHSLALEAQVGRLTGAVGRIENAMASMSVAVRREGGGTRRRTVPGPTARDKTHDEVLIEVFESNLELMRGWEDPASLPAERSQASS